MINERELRLGSKIQQGNVFNILHHKGRLGVIVIDDYSSIAGDFYSMDEIEPIELTEDLLLEYELQKHPTKREYLLYKCGGMTLYTTDGTSFVLQTVGKHKLAILKYFHQLQNWYFNLSGGYELTKSIDYCNGLDI